YRKIPPFGRGTIRRFPGNVCDMKQLAARDFEDMLQCAIPVFEGILPDEEHNLILLDMLFYLANWHGLAKLRLHTDDSLDQLEHATFDLSASVRKFLRHVCPFYDTRELPNETSARGRRALTKSAIQAARSKGKGRAADVSVDAKRKKLNVNTYKFHVLGDYVNHIRRYGTTDSYNSLHVSHSEIIPFPDSSFTVRTRALLLKTRLSIHWQKTRLHVACHDSAQCTQPLYSQTTPFSR
ncbi:hypothetical protein CONPUDRAFT_68210, partial [Coniophora puteana RWD-64-598 SS2]